MTEIIYFVGAGLSKSLERKGVPIPLMQDFISVLADWLDDDVILSATATLEADNAFSKRHRDGIALARQIAGYAIGECPQELREQYRQVLKSREHENIEDMLKNAGGKRLHFGYAINRLFSLIGWNADFSHLESFLARMLNRPDTRHTFVSFNYDLLLDNAVDRLSNGRWNVWHGYGFGMRQFLTPTAIRAHMTRLNEAADQSDPPDRLDCQETPWGKVGRSETVQILKPHGSLNWLAVIGNEHHYDIDSAPCVCIGDDGSLVYFPERECRHLWSVDHELVERMGVLVIPPVAKEAHILPKIFMEEELALRKADEVYVLGWSMPETDYGQVDMIRSISHDRMDPFKRLVVVSKGAPKDYVKRIAGTFRVPQEEIEVFDQGFESATISTERHVS